MHSTDVDNVTMMTLQDRRETMKSDLARIERDLETRRRLLERVSEDGFDEAFARELHATLCSDINCAGFQDDAVEHKWTDYARQVISSLPRQVKPVDFLTVAHLVSGNPFYQSVRSMQDYIESLRPSATVGGPSTSAVETTPSVPFVEPAYLQPPTDASSGPTVDATAAAAAASNLTDDDIPF